MCALLSSTREGEPPPDVPRCQALYVLDHCYANAAAKFWASLVDEVQEDYTTCTDIELTAVSGCKLVPDHLFPAASLQRALQDLWSSDLESVMRDVVAEMNLLGPPAPVNVRLLSGTETLLERMMPLDCLDADLFPYLMVWPLKWAEIPAPRWNEERLSGDCVAEDRKRGLLYALSFSLLTQHISEGLYRRVLTLTAAVSGLA